MDEKKKHGIVLIIIAACFWGSMGIFVRRLGNYGFSSIQIVSIRITIAAVIFSIILLIKDKTGFRISLKDIPLFLGLDQKCSMDMGVFPVPRLKPHAS